MKNVQHYCSHLSAMKTIGSLPWNMGGSLNVAPSQLITSTSEVPVLLLA